MFESPYFASRHLQMEVHQDHSLSGDTSAVVRRLSLSGAAKDIGGGFIIMTRLVVDIQGQIMRLLFKCFVEKKSERSALQYSW